MNKKLALVDRVAFLKKLCKGKKVLHLGCADYPFTQDSIDAGRLLHFELDKITEELYGFDFDEKGLKILEENGATNLYQADLENLDAVDLDKKFDVIVAGEMIEHLSNPGLFLKGIQRYMSEDTKLLITTINAYMGMRFWIYGLRGRGGSFEPVHQDHVAYYSYSTLNLIVERENLKVDEFMFYNLGDEHRVHLPWHYKFCNDVCVKIAPHWADGVIAVCRL